MRRVQPTFRDGWPASCARRWRTTERSAHHCLGEIARVATKSTERAPHILILLAGRLPVRLLVDWMLLFDAFQLCAESVFVVCGATAVRHAALAYACVPMVGLQMLAGAYPPLPFSAGMCKEPGVYRCLVFAVSGSRHRCSNPDVVEIADSPSGVLWGTGVGGATVEVASTKCIST